jgi:hypothetical protein
VKHLIEDFPLTLSLEIDATYHKFQRGHFEKGGLQIDPDEPAWYEINEVMCNGIDISALFTDENAARLEQMLLDNHDGPDPDDLRDRQRDDGRGGE